jgi:hypothetical protein
VTGPSFTSRNSPGVPARVTLRIRQRPIGAHDFTFRFPEASTTVIAIRLRR